MHVLTWKYLRECFRGQQTAVIRLALTFYILWADQKPTLDKLQNIIETLILRTHQLPDFFVKVCSVLLFETWQHIPFKPSYTAKLSPMYGAIPCSTKSNKCNYHVLKVRNIFRQAGHNKMLIKSAFHILFFWRNWTELLPKRELRKPWDSHENTLL